MVPLSSILIPLLTSATAVEAERGWWRTAFTVLPWLLLVVVIGAAAAYLLMLRRKVVECQAREEIRVLIENAGQMEDLWAEKYSDLKKKLKKDLARQEKHLRHYYNQQLERYKEELQLLREQNLELKESVGQLMQSLKKR